MWQKVFGVTNKQNVQYILAAMIVLLLCGLVFSKPVLFLLAGLFCVYALLNNWYDKTIGKKLQLLNPKQTSYLFAGDESTLVFVFANHSRFPIIHAELTIQLDSVTTIPQMEQTNKGSGEYVIPLSLTGKGKTKVTLMTQAQQRGIARVKNMTLRFPHLFNFDDVILKYDGYYHREFVVYPQPRQVYGWRNHSNPMFGMQKATFSLLDDIQLKQGTRPYVGSDPFHRINWKQSAKTGQLQTNVFEHKLDRSYSILVNISGHQGKRYIGVHQHMEEILSFTTYLSEQMLTKGYPYKLFLNVRKPGVPSFMSIPHGEGNHHFAKTLDMLARIKKQSVLIPFKQLLYHVYNEQIHTGTIIIIGDIPAGVRELLMMMASKSDIYHIKPNGKEKRTMMQKWNVGVMSNAK